jgi:hypothetical protein
MERKVEISGIMRDVCERLHLDKKLSSSVEIGVVFVYTPQKVGSTSLVTSLRLCANEYYYVCHIHDESKMGIPLDLQQKYNITVRDLIEYNRDLGRAVYVIDIYRSPIERKMSFFFENLAWLHFNVDESKLKNYSIDRITTRFNSVFPYIANEDYYYAKYFEGCEEKPQPIFDFEKKYLKTVMNGVTYIKLRLMDSEKYWPNILTELLGVEINICKDYETRGKEIGELYSKFASMYKIPLNHLSSIESSESERYYKNEEERMEYINNWKMRSTILCVMYDKLEYDLYESISKSNSQENKVRIGHYLDNGCSCDLCQNKRVLLRKSLLLGKKEYNESEKIFHCKVQKEENKKIVERINKINRSIAIANIGIAKKNKKNENIQIGSNIMKKIIHTTTIPPHPTHPTHPPSK